MKVLIFVAALFALAYADFTPATGADLIKYREECVSKLEIPPEVVEEFKKWQFTNEKSACYTECIFEKMHLFNDNAFNVDNLAIQLSHGDRNPDELKEGINACIDNSITDPCQKAFKGFECFKANNLYMIQRSVSH